MNETPSSDGPAIEITPEAPAPPPMPVPARLSEAMAWKFATLAERRGAIEREMRALILATGIDPKTLDGTPITVVLNEASSDFGALVDARSNQPVLLIRK